MLNRVFPRIKKILAILCLFTLPIAQVFAASQSEQTIEWKKDPNALEYKIEIRPMNGGKPQLLRTKGNTITVTLELGSYKYRVTALDFLGRESSVSDWIELDLLKSSIPVIEDIAEEAEIVPKNGSLELAVHIMDISTASIVELVNDKGEVFRGRLHMAKDNVSQGGSETEHADTVTFEDIPDGDYKIRITNPSGKTTETNYISIQKSEASETDVITQETEDKAVETEDKTQAQEEQSQDTQEQTQGTEEKSQDIEEQTQDTDEKPLEAEEQHQETKEQTQETEEQPQETEEKYNEPEDKNEEAEKQNPEPADQSLETDGEPQEDEIHETEKTSQDSETQTESVIKKEKRKFSEYSILFGILQCSNQMRHTLTERDVTNTAPHSDEPAHDAPPSPEKETEESPEDETESQGENIPAAETESETETNSEPEIKTEPEAETGSDAKKYKKRFNIHSVLFGILQCSNQLRNTMEKITHAEASENQQPEPETEETKPNVGIEPAEEPETSDKDETEEERDLSWLPIHPYYPVVMPQDLVWREFFVGPLISIFMPEGLVPPPEHDAPVDRTGEEVLAVEPVIKRQVEEESPKAEKKPYVCKDVIFSLGAGFFTAPVDETVMLLSDWDIIPELNAHLTWLPYKGKKWKLGYELSGKMVPLISSSEYHNSKIFLYMAQFNLVYQHTFFSPKLFWSIRLGGGAAIADAKIDYTASQGNRKNIDENLIRPMGQAGLSLFWIPAKHFTIESGVDAGLVLDSDFGGLFLDPYISFGLRL